MRRYGALVGLVAVGLAAAVVILGARWHVEQQTRTVEVILDGAAWQEIAAALYRYVGDKSATSPSGLTSSSIDSLLTAPPGTTHAAPSWRARCTNASTPMTRKRATCKASENASRRRNARLSSRLSAPKSR